MNADTGDGKGLDLSLLRYIGLFKREISWVLALGMRKSHRVEIVYPNLVHEVRATGPVAVTKEMEIFMKLHSVYNGRGQKTLNFTCKS